MGGPVDSGGDVRTICTDVPLGTLAEAFPVATFVLARSCLAAVAATGVERGVAVGADTELRRVT